MQGAISENINHIYIAPDDQLLSVLEYGRRNLSLTIMDTQLLPPPDGNQNRTGQILGACLGFLVMSCVFVTLRLYTRLFLIKSARWDDWTIVLALVLSSLFGLPNLHADLDEAWQHRWGRT